MKKCTKCSEVKPLTEFCRNNRLASGRGSLCKSCDTVRVKQYRRSEKGKTASAKYRASQRGRAKRKNDELKKFGITSAFYNKLHNEQKGLCAVCGMPESVVRFGAVVSLAVDHCHTTGKVRGLLCNSCNLGLGNLKDNIDIMASAISYLINSKL